MRSVIISGRRRYRRFKPWLVVAQLRGQVMEDTFRGQIHTVYEAVALLNFIDTQDSERAPPRSQTKSAPSPSKYSPFYTAHRLRKPSTPARASFRIECLYSSSRAAEWYDGSVFKDDTADFLQRKALRPTPSRWCRKVGKSSRLLREAYSTSGAIYCGMLSDGCCWAAETRFHRCI